MLFYDGKCICLDLLSGWIGVIFYALYNGISFVNDIVTLNPKVIFTLI